MQDQAPISPRLRATASILIAAIVFVASIATSTPAPPTARPGTNLVSATCNKGTLAINGSGSGSLAWSPPDALPPPSSYDFWCYTPTTDGILQLTVMTAGVQVNAELYDTDSSTFLIRSNYGSSVTFRYALGPGTFFIKVRLTGWSAGSYTISNTFTPASLPNDQEPNNTAGTAQALSSPGSTTGHLGYHSGGITDSVDWFKISPTGDGVLQVLAATDGIQLNLELYDTDGSTFLIRSNYGSSVSFNFPLGPGTFFIKVRLTDLSGAAGSYTISNTFTPASLPNDQEPNNTSGTAQALLLPGSTTGHLGYHSLGVTDTADWFKVSPSSDGIVQVQVVTDGIQVNAELYDTDGSTFLIRSNYGSSVSFTYALGPGTFFVKVRLTGGLAGSYTVTDTFSPASLPNDNEPNNTSGTAQALALPSSTTGHLGYHSSGLTDSFDWFKIAPSTSGTLHVQAATDGIQVNAELYGSDGSTFLTRSNYGSSVSFTYALGPGIFFIKLRLTAGLAGSYTITATGVVGGPLANFTWSPQNPAAGQLVQFTDTSTGSPTSWSWNFGDAGTSASQNPTHSYSAAGTYSVTLSVSSSSGSNSITKQLTVTASGGPRVSGRVKIGAPGDYVDVINLPPSQLGPIKLHVESTSTVLLMRLDPNGTFNSRDLLDGSPPESSLPSGPFSAHLDGNLTYFDHITVDNTTLDPFPLPPFRVGCPPPAAGFITRILVIPAEPVTVPSGASQTIDVHLKRPLVMIHGIRDCYSGWTDWVDDVTTTKGYMTFTPSHHFIGFSKEVEADEVKSQLDADFTQMAGHVRYSIICHSEGGVVARVMSNRPAVSAGIVKIYALGTPHSGSTLSLFQGPIDSYQLSQATMERGFNRQYPTFGRPVLAAGGLGCAGRDDCVVKPNESVFKILQRLPVFGLFWQYREYPSQIFALHEFADFCHYTTLVGCPSLRSSQAESPILENCVLADAQGDACPTGPSPRQSTRQNIREIVLPASPASEGQILSALPILAAGETWDLGIPISRTDLATFYLTPLSANALLSLVDPSGASISQTNVSLYPAVQYSSSEFGQAFQVASPMAGTWHLKIAAGAQTGVVAVGATENSVWQLLVTTDKVAYAPSGQAILNARLDGALTGVSIGSMTATVANSAGQAIGSVTLYDDGAHNDGAAGDGVYGNTFTVPSSTDQYPLTFEATGTCQGASFKRQAIWGLDVKAASPLFTGSFSDSALDTDLDGNMDTIAETVGLNVPNAGEYVISGDLFDASGYSVSHSVVRINPAGAGPVNAVLSFDLSRASCSEFSAPFQVKNLVVSNPTNGYSILDTWAPAVATSLYVGTSFGCGTNPNPAPSVTAVSPNAGFPGDPVTINISGSGFLSGASVKFGSYTTGITANVLDGGLIVANWTIPAGATPGPLDLTVVNVDSQQGTLPGGFTIATDQPPSVSIFYPTDGQVVIGIVVVSATASDDRGVQKVEFYLDGVLSATDTSFPYQFTVDTTGLTTGAHSLQARAYDSAGQVGVSPSVEINVNTGFFTVIPCRVLDTRNPDGPLGGPALAASADRTFTLAGQCGIPLTAKAVSINVTITQPTALGDMRLYPGGSSLPLVSTINYRPGQTRANNAVAPLGAAGDLVVHCDQASGTVHLIVDVNGYFE